jgi:4-carboxymuconolactone decarboxylase
MDRDRGLTVLSEMLGEEQAREVQQTWKKISPDFEKYVIGFLAGEIWPRTELDRRTRSLCTIAVLGALGRERALDLNIRMALRNGASQEEILETLLHLAPYAGFPAAWESIAMASKIFAETDESSGKQKASPNS